VRVDLDVGDPGEICFAAQPDEGGSVPLRLATYDSQGLHSSIWSFYQAADGTPLSRREWTSGLGPVSLLAQPKSFIGIGFAGDATQADLDLFILGHDGSDVSLLHTEAAAGDGDPVADPSGGTVLFSVHRDASLWLLVFERYDAQGVRALEGVDGVGGPAAQDVRWVAGVTTGGDTLVVVGPQGGPCNAVWLDHEGAKVSAAFAPPACRISRLYPLLDGGLAVETTSLDASHSITGAVAPRATSFGPAPAFLDGVSVREFFLLPGRRQYALREQGSAGLRLLQTDGKICETLTPPLISQGPIQIGRDGTLVEQETSGAGCAFRWYPGLIK
jgi:hypothetical protein